MVDVNLNYGCQRVGQTNKLSGVFVTDWTCYRVHHRRLLPGYLPEELHTAPWLYFLFAAVMLLAWCYFLSWNCALLFMVERLNIIIQYFYIIEKKILQISAKTGVGSWQKEMFNYAVAFTFFYALYLSVVVGDKLSLHIPAGYALHPLWNVCLTY